MCWPAASGCLLDKVCSFTQFTKALGNNIENVDVKIKVDMNERALHYSIDGEEYKEAPCQLQQYKAHRLVVTTPMRCISEIELL